MVTLKNFIVSNETPIGEDKYSNTITLILTTNIPNVADFSANIQVECDNSLTGFEVDAKRQTEIDAFILETYNS